MVQWRIRGWPAETQGRSHPAGSSFPSAEYLTRLQGKDLGWTDLTTVAFFCLSLSNVTAYLLCTRRSARARLEQETTVNRWVPGHLEFRFLEDGRPFTSNFTSNTVSNGAESSDPLLAQPAPYPVLAPQGLCTPPVLFPSHTQGSFLLPSWVSALMSLLRALLRPPCNVSSPYPSHCAAGHSVLFSSEHLVLLKQYY